MSKNNTKELYSKENIEILNYCKENNLIKDNGFLEEYLEGLNINPKNNLLTGKRKSWQDIRDSLITPDFCPFRRGYVNNISSVGGIGKSALTLQTAIIHILNEKYEHGRDIKVLFWSNEDSFEDIADRFKMICNEILFLPLSDIEYVNDRLTVLDGDSNIFPFFEGEKNYRKVSESFKKFKQAAEQFDLIILDPLLSFYSSSELDENNNSEAKMFMFLLTSWTFETKKTIIVISHSAKGSVNIRGAQGFLDAFRYSISIHRYEEPLMDESKKTIIKDLRTGEILYKETPELKHLREIRILKDNGNIAEFIRVNKEQFKLSFNNPRIFSLQIFPKSFEYQKVDYEVPEKRFVIQKPEEVDEFDMYKENN
ncbi:AAA family ATPase [Aliarcobacter butzleri]|uniref:AAA family ATPase n=1 Tax=Aliarcobacter butzleri TaxID=28197 RepID=UPI0024DE337A|nr:AAA family ATPase [Aliarcobacter butzleri]MDK2063317.1 AAA family ATPase [Aliarcobacter butzleri]